MTDNATVHIGENSPEQVAYKLLSHVANCEKRSLSGGAGNGYTTADRKYILDTYAECLETITMPHRRRD